MAKKLLVIDSVISPWMYSKQVVRNFLNTAGKDPVDVHISSPGGDVDHAIDIYNQFKDHGNVTARLSGFVASSATLIALGAAKTIIESNSYYLIHKPMKWVDEWGNMNSDDIDQLITNLEKAKDMLEKVTLGLVKMYMGKTGKSAKEILDLMKESKWLNATEAKEWGFVDEIAEPDQVKNWLEDERMIAIILGNELPNPIRSQQPTVNQPQSELSDGQVDSLWNRMIDRVKSLIHPQTVNIKMKIFNLVNKVLGVTALESTDGKGVYLNEAQLQAIEDRLAAADQAEQNRTQAETNLQNATTALDEIDPTVASAKTIGEKVTAIKAKLAEKPGKGATQVPGKQDPVEDGVDWNTINNLPHNKEYDELN